MFECLVLGDSIAVGTGDAVNKRLVVPCAIHAERSATVDAVRRWRLPVRDFGATIVAVGSNNRADRKLEPAITRLRGTLRSARVIWLLPYARAQAHTVSRVAARFGDETLDLRAFATRDQVHPARYGDVARALLQPAGTAPAVRCAAINRWP